MLPDRVSNPGPLALESSYYCFGSLTPVNADTRASDKAFITLLYSSVQSKNTKKIVLNVKTRK